MLRNGTLSAINVVKQLLLFILIMGVTQGGGVAQSTTNVSITGIPGILPSPFFSDFEQNVYNGVYQVQANVVGNSSVNVRLHVTISKEGQELVDETSLPVELDPGMNILSPFPNFVEFSKTTNQVLNDLPSDMVQQVFQGGTFPEGEYTITMQAYEVGSSIPAGSSGVATFMVRYPQPSILLTPANATKVEVDFPVFSWTPVMAPQGTTIEYDFLLVEVFDGQNPGDALLSNREHAAVQLIGNTTLPYTGEFLPLEKGKTYAWQVRARDANDQIPIKNNGRSEIYVFTYGEEPDEDEDIVDLIPTIPSYDIPEFDPIPISTITGSVNWTFRPSEGFQDLIPFTPDLSHNLQSTDDNEVGISTIDPNYNLGQDTDFGQPLFTPDTPDVTDDSDLTIGAPQITTPEQASQVYVPVFGGGIDSGVELSNTNNFESSVINQLNEIMNQMTEHPYQEAKVKAIYRDDEGEEHVIATTNANEEGHFTLAFVPSELDQLSSQQNGASANQSFSLDQRPGEIDTEALQQQYQQRDFSEIAAAQRADIYIKIDSRYFEFPEETSVSVNKRDVGSYDVGTIRGTALTYRFVPELVDRETGREIEATSIEIFRPDNWYEVFPVLRPEGSPLDDDERDQLYEIGSYSAYKVAEGVSTQAFSRLFPSRTSSIERYILRIEARGYRTLTTFLSANPSISVDDIVTVRRTYEMNLAPPSVEGRVVRRDTQAPMDNVAVILIPPHGSDNDPEGAYAAVTDSDGRFIIEDIEPREEEYTLTLSGSAVAAYEEEILLNENGIVIERDPLMVDPSLVTITGRVANTDDEPIANAILTWEDGGNPVHSDEQGRFVTANTEGIHTLQVRKIGHADVDTTISINVEADDDFTFIRDLPGGNWTEQVSTSFGNAVGNWTSNLMDTPDFQEGENDEEPSGFNPSNIGHSGYEMQNFNISQEESESIIAQNNLNISSDQFYGFADLMSGIAGAHSLLDDYYSIGTITMTRAVGRLAATVLAADTGSPVEGAIVTVGIAGPEGATDSSGYVYLDETPAGTVPVSVKAPETTNYVPIETEVTITDSGDTTYVDLELELGTRASGVVTALGDPVEDAIVRVEGRDDISTRSDDDGNYILAGIPEGEWTLRATKSGYVGASDTRDFTADEEEQINFSLEDAGFNITSLLGFEIEVEEFSLENDTTITGAFVNIQPNDLFSVAEDLRIPFSGIPVYEEDGDLRPVNGMVQTNASQINARVFDFLHIEISDNNGIIARPRQIGSSVGYLAGRVEIDYAATFTSATGWEWPDVSNQYLTIPDTGELPGSLAEEQLVTLTSDGSFPFPDIAEVSDLDEFAFTFGGANQSFTLFGFDINLDMDETELKFDGIHMGASVGLGNIPLIDEAGINLEHLWIGHDGTVRDVNIQLDPAPEIALADWRLMIDSGMLSETGFSLGGLLELGLPGSDLAEIGFSKLSISSDMLHGGEFSFPAGGIDIFGIVNMMTLPGEDISFGSITADEVFYITGGARIDLPRYVDEALVFRDFLLQSNGEFDLTIESNFEADFFGLADLTVTGVRVQNTTSPALHVDGQFGLHGIPFISAQAGGLTYEPGESVSFDEIDLEFDMSTVGVVAAGIGLIDTAARQGFSGSGSMDITGTPISAGIEFNYERVNGGIAVGAQVEAGVPAIPMGNFSITNIGGGFSYDQSAENFSITVTGRVEVAPGTGRAVALDPLEVSVESGPVITGFAALTIMQQSIADASLTIDFPNRLFDVEAEVGFERLEDVNIDVSGASRLVISGHPNDTYWMVGALFNAELFGLFNANANILAAWNLNVNAHPEYDQYTSFVSDDFITGGVISGAHLDVGTEFGIPRSDKRCFSFKVGSACGYFMNETRCQLNADFEGSNFGFYLGSNWEGGGNVTLLSKDVGGAHIGASGSVEGNYVGGVWSASGTANAEFSGYIGSCNVGCRTTICRPSCGLFSCPVPKGASLCVSGSIGVDYNSNTGMDVSVSF